MIDVHNIFPEFLFADQGSMILFEIRQGDESMVRSY